MTLWLWKAKPEPDFCSHVLGAFGEGYDRKTMPLVHGPKPLAIPWPGLRVENCVFQSDGKKRPPADYLMVNNESNFVASDRLRALLEGQGVAGEYFPVEIDDPEVAVDGAYWYLRILARVEAREVLDLAASGYELDGIGIGKAERLVFLDSRLPDTPLFRMTGGPGGILARDRLKRAVDAAGLTGMYFLHPDERDKDPSYYEAFVEAAIRAKT